MKAQAILVPVDAISIPRGRREARDLDTLKQSISTIGLLNPITVTPEKRLIAGRRRLTACKQLGWSSIPAVVANLDELRARLAEHHENLLRSFARGVEIKTWRHRDVLRLSTEAA